MENKVNVSINIEGTDITHFSTFKLVQRFNEHHSFELRFDYDQIETLGTLSLDKSKNFVGKNISISFGSVPGQEQIFIGKITRVEFAHSNGYQGELVISGYSPTILLERGPDLGSYLGKNLQSIISQATADAPSNDLNMQIKPVHTATIDYIMQYRESDFAFLNRLSAEYYEWFFYDGMNLNFGKPDKQKEVSLTYGRNLHTLQYAMQVAPLKYDKYAYNPKQDELLTSQPAGASGSSPDTSFAINASNQMFSKTYSQPLSVRVDSKEQIDEFVNNEQKALISELVHVSGSGDEPLVAIGSILNITSSTRSVNNFEEQSFGKFLVTSVYHQVDDVGHYQNTFEAVSADTERLQVKQAEKPFADMQLATVLDNDDPQKQGRVKVQFKWQCTSNDPTEWLRVMSPNAGHGDTGKNRGFLVVPEKGDQVIVGFEEGNIARPVVMGSVYHSNNVDSGGFTNSNIKGMMSRKGSNLTFNDAEHALMLATSLSNIIQVHEGEGVVQSTAAQSISHKTGDNLIEIQNKGGSITLNAKTAITIQTGASSITLNTNGTISIKGNIFTVEAKNNHIQGESKLDGGNVFIN